MAIPTVNVSEVDLPLYQKLPAFWKLKASPVILRPLDGGKSGAGVFVVQVSPKDGPSEDALIFGEYVLKFDAISKWAPAEPVEWQRHEAARRRNPVFGEDHIPPLIRHAELDGRIAMLYDIAGSSLASFVTASAVENQGALLKQLRRISMAMLDNLNPQREDKPGVAAREILETILGYRLDGTEGRALHDFVLAEYGGAASTVIAGRVMANALQFCSNSVIREDASRVMYLGLLHGDLHLGNILLDKARPDSREFWVIDFALSAIGPIGYDHS
ncbi:MAG: phosphotransferase [Bryobacteraceae bacterium]